MEASLKLCLAAILIAGQVHTAPVLPSNVLVLVPRHMPSSRDAHSTRMVQISGQAMSSVSPAASGKSVRSTAGRNSGHAPPVAHIVLVRPVRMHAAPAQPVIHQQVRAITNSFPFPFVSDQGNSSRQSITQAPERREDEPLNVEQSIDQQKGLFAGAEQSNTTDLSFYIPTKINGSTVFVEKDVTIPINGANEEELAAALIASDTEEKLPSTGTLLHGLTREELSEIVRKSVLEVLREHGGHFKTSNSQKTSSTTRGTTETVASESDVDQDSVSTAPPNVKDESEESDTEDDSESTSSQDQEKGSQELKKPSEPKVNNASTLISKKTKPTEDPEDEDEDEDEDGEEDGEADGEVDEEKGEDAGGDKEDGKTTVTKTVQGRQRSGSKAGVVAVAANAEATDSQQKVRRQLPPTLDPGKKSFKRMKSQRAGKMMVPKILKPISSSTPGPEAMSPLDQTGMMDPVILTDFQDELLKNKQIVIIDRDRHKNQLFLKAIKEVLQDFEKMYETPHYDDEDPATLSQTSSNSIANTLIVSAPVSQAPSSTPPSTVMPQDGTTIENTETNTTASTTISSMSTIAMTEVDQTPEGNSQGNVTQVPLN